MRGLSAFLCLLLFTAQDLPAKPQPSPPAVREEAVKALVREIAASGRVTAGTESPSQRVSSARQIAPGAPPLLTFRYLEGSDRHRFNQLGLVLDDAGH